VLRLLGVDFSCAPSRKKPITVARGHRVGTVLKLDAVDEVQTLPGFEQLLAAPGPWLGAFDFPFGLPREFVDAHQLGDSTDAVIHALHQRCATRMDFRALVDAWGNGRPAGQRLIHRRADGAMPGISSTSPLQTRYVPVGLMYYEGLSRLMKANVHIPRQREGDLDRTALEGYPGLLAFELIGRRSYKNSTEPDRLIARKDMLEALEQGRTRLGLRLKLSHAMREGLADDASGDRLDAVLCLLQAAWASAQPAYGLPPEFDAVEGWICSAI
jgi:Protein of unknown function (DUF429)